MKTILGLFITIVSFNTMSFAQNQLNDPERSFGKYDALSNILKIANFKGINDPATLDSFILSKMEQYKFPGMSVCIIKDDQVIWKNVYGHANVAQHKLVTDSTIFYLASVSKLFTGTAIMQLWEQGLFELDDDVNDYLPFQLRNPNFPDVPITFRMLLAHTSSIHWEVNTITWGADSPIELGYYVENFLVPGGEYYSNNNWNTWMPGMQYEYGSMDFSVLGYLVEKITNMSFEQYSQDSIFVPLGMDNTSWFLANLNVNDIITPYNNTNGAANVHWGVAESPGTQVRTGMNQLTRFLIAYMQKGQIDDVQILESSTVDSMMTVHNPDIHETQGLAWFLSKKNVPFVGNKIVSSHLGGWNAGAGSLVGYIQEKEENIGAIVLTNKRVDGGIVEIGLELLSYGLLSNKIYAQNVKINSPFMLIDKDTLLVKAEFVNPNDHNFSANALISSIDSVYNDSIPLYDDGNHGDLLAGDGLWGNFIAPISDENTFKVGVSTNDLDSSGYFVLNDLTRFTSAGPVIVDSISTVRRSAFYPTRLTFDIFLLNKGETATVRDIAAILYPDTTHPCFDRIGIVNRTVGDISAGESEIARSFSIYMSETCSGDTIFTIPFSLEISSEDYVFWNDESRVVTAIEEITDNKPLTYKLQQNYPNPFNPTTNIEYTVRAQHAVPHVNLSIYNLLGQKVATLVNKKQAAGSYQVEWDASGFATGIYYYKLTTGDFQQVKKMVLIK